MTWFIIIQIILLGIRLSADAFSVALTDGLTYTDIDKKNNLLCCGCFWLYVSIIFILTFSISLAGLFLGNKIMKLLKNRYEISGIIGGIILILLV